MKRIIVRTVLFFILFVLAIPSEARNYRYYYVYEYKDSPSSKTYKGDYSMCLEVLNGKSIFYSESRYLRDSIARAGLSKGKPVSQIQEEYSEIPRGTTRIIRIDFKTKKFVEYDYFLSRIYKCKPESLNLPKWEVKPGNETIQGYNCKKAEAYYYGRKWVIWFTSEIPVNAGPWLLWGAPGLIVRAEDSEGLFRFLLNVVEATDYPRIEKGVFTYTNTGKKEVSTEMSIKDFEQKMNYCHREPSQALETISGVRVSSITDAKGNSMDPSISKPYIPLIPDSFWRGQ